MLRRLLAGLVLALGVFCLVGLLSAWTQYGPCCSGYSVIYPTGNSTTDYIDLSTAFSNSATQPVLLEPTASEAVFNVYQPLTIPAWGVVQGKVLANNFFYSTPNTPPLQIQCAGTSTFTNGQAQITLGVGSALAGIYVNGQGAGSGSTYVDCFQVKNAQMAVMAYDNCQQPHGNGLNLVSTASGTPVQLFYGDHVYVNNANEWSVVTTESGGGYVSDNRLVNSWTEGGDGEVNLNSGSIDLISDRLEDSYGWGLQIVGINASVVGSTIANNASGDINLYAVSNVNIVGNVLNSGGFYSDTPPQVIAFGSTNSNVILDGNSYGPNPGGANQTTNVYSTNNSASCANCVFADNPSASVANVSGALYDSVATLSMMMPGQKQTAKLAMYSGTINSAITALPTCGSSLSGVSELVSDGYAWANSGNGVPGGTYAGGNGSTQRSVRCNGTNWVYQ